MKSVVMLLAVALSAAALGDETLQFTESDSQALLKVVGAPNWAAVEGSATLVCAKFCAFTAKVTQIYEGHAYWSFPAKAGESYFDLFQLPVDPSIDPGYSGETKTFTSASGKIRITAMERGGGLSVSLDLGQKLAVNGAVTTYSTEGSLVAVLPEAQAASLRKILPERGDASRRGASAGLGAIQLACVGDYCQVGLHEMPRAIPGIRYSVQGNTHNVSVDENELGIPGDSLYSQLDVKPTICRGGRCKQFSTSDGSIAVTAFENGRDFLSIRRK
jgi:hypothetical protein